MFTSQLVNYYNELKEVIFRIMLVVMRKVETHNMKLEILFPKRYENVNLT